MNERSVFLAALELDDPQRRATYVRDACGDNADLRRGVEELLQANAVAGSFMDTPAATLGGCTADTQSDGAIALDFLAPSDRAGCLGRLGSYEITRVIGQGGMGIVLEARDTRLDRIVAIKVLTPHCAATAIARQRFLREAKATAAVRDEHVVTIYAVEEAEGIPYLVMELIAGMSLQDRIDRDGPLELREILRIGMQAAHGLAAAHAQGLIHRDVKPANILLENGVERVKLTDFGLARVVDDASLTQSGVIAGTPQYMAPEQAKGEAVDHRADLFSLGSALYAMCTGRPPFRASTTMGVLKRICEEPLSPIRKTNPSIPEWLAALIDKLHAKRPAERYQSAAEVADLMSQQLANLQHPAKSGPVHLPIDAQHDRQPVQHTRWAIAAAAAVLLLVGASLTEATGVTQLVPTIIRIVIGEGLLVIEVDDPTVSVTLDGQDITISGAGIHQLRLRPGTHRFVATKNGQPAHTELVTIQKGQRKVVTVTLEPKGPLEANGDVPRRDRVAAVVPAATPTRTSSRLFDQHASHVQSLALLPNGKLLLTGRHDGTVQLLDLDTGQLLRPFLGHRNPVWSVAFSPDGSRALTCGDGTLRLWNVETGQELRRFPGHAGDVRCVAFAPDGQRALTGGGDKMLRLWQLETGEELRTLKGHSDGVMGLAFSADGRRALSGSRDLTMKLWNVETGEELRNFAGHETWVWSVAFSADGRRALSGSGTHNVYQGAPFDCLVRLWDVESGDLLRTMAGHAREVTGVAFCSNGQHILSTANEGRLWDANTGALLQRFIGHQATIACLATSSDGRQFVTGSNDGTLRLWQLPAELPQKVPMQK